MIERKRLPGTPVPRHRWPGAGGGYLAADAWGPADGPPVVLLHGGGQTRHAWGGTGARLGAAGYFAVAYDTRGHGDSDWAPDANYGLDAMVDDLERVVAELGERRPVLMGASMGGIVSLVAAGEARVNALALVLVDVAPRVEADGSARVRSFMSQSRGGFDSLEQVAEAIARYHPERPRPRSLDGLAKNVRLGSDSRYYWHWDPRYIERLPDPVRQHARLSDCARRFGGPTLLVRGAMSDVLSEDGAREFLALCPQAEYVDVKGAGHMVAGDRNDLFGRAAIRFLERRVPLAAATR